MSGCFSATNWLKNWSSFYWWLTWAFVVVRWLINIKLHISFRLAKRVETRSDCSTWADLRIMRFCLVQLDWTHRSESYWQRSPFSIAESFCDSGIKPGALGLILSSSSVEIELTSLGANFCLLVFKIWSFWASLKISSKLKSSIKGILFLLLFMMLRDSSSSKAFYLI